MISEKMAKRLNQQMNVEFFAAYKYLAMSAYFEEKNLKGFASWFAVQGQEERLHAMKIYQYLLDQDATIELMPIEAPPQEFASPLDVFQKALQSEQYVSKCINELLTFARGEKDNATDIFLQWFVNEQVEEEALMRDILSQVEMVNQSVEGLFLINRELAKRSLEDTETAAD